MISPEGCAAILWKDRAAAPKAAEALKITARHLLELGLVDDVIPEPLGGAHTQPAAAGQTLRESLLRHLAELEQKPLPELLKQRYDRFRALGRFSESVPVAA